MESRNKNGHATVKSIVEKSGLSFEMSSRRKFSCYLNENGYGYLLARKKGLLSENDRKLRIRFARKMKRVVAQNPHKYNPRSGANINRWRVWRQKGEGLKLRTKGSKDSAGGRRLHVLAAIAYKKGVVLAVPHENMNGTFFAQFIKAFCHGQ